MIDNNVAEGSAGSRPAPDQRRIGTGALRSRRAEGGWAALSRTEHLLRRERGDRLRQPVDDRTDARHRGHDQGIGHVRHRDSHRGHSGQPDDRAHLADPIPTRLDQAELTSLLLTGRQLSDARRSSRPPRSALRFWVISAGDVLGFAGRAVGLDTLRVGAETNPRDPADLAAQTDPTSAGDLWQEPGLEARCHALAKPGREQRPDLDHRLPAVPPHRVPLRVRRRRPSIVRVPPRRDVRAAPAAIRSGDVSREVEQPRVSSVRLMGNLRFPEPQVRSQLRLNEGNRFDFIDWQDDRDRLERFYQRQQHLAARIDGRPRRVGGRCRPDLHDRGGA